MDPKTIISAPLDSPATLQQPTPCKAANNINTMIDNTHEPMRNYDGTEMRDAQSKIIYRSQFLSTHPLRSDCKERVGYAGKKFTYVSGDGVIRTMNAIFGHGGWSSQITMERNVLNEKDDRGRWNVGYLSTVKVTLLNGVSHEDCGSGEGIDNNKLKAHEKAMKSAITDAMKRAARHFGERLGNALYVKGSGIRTAPRTNKDALSELERKDALNLFGDQATLRANQYESPDKKQTHPSNATLAIVGTAAAATTHNSTTVGQNLVPNTYNNTRDSTGSIAAVTQHKAASMVMPSPIDSTNVHHRVGTLQQQQQQQQQHAHVINNGVRGGNPSQVVYNTNNNQQHLFPQPPNLMAPPQRSMYNPPGGGSTAQYSAGAGAKRGLDGIGNQHNMNMGSSNNHNMNGSNSADATKRQKINPYNNSNTTSSTNSRLSTSSC